MKCKICGRVHTRRACEFCEREKKWDSVKIKWRKKILPPRVLRDLEICKPSKDLIQDHNKNSICIQGPVGSGKTIFAAMILESRKKRAFVENKPFPAYFISVPFLLSTLRNTFSAGVQQDTEMDLITLYGNIEHLLLDDLGSEKSTDWSLQSLYIIINSRYENLKPTIFTNNFDLDQLAEKLGDDRIPSRIHSMCYIHTLKGSDRRLEG